MINCILGAVLLINGTPFIHITNIIEQDAQVGSKIHPNAHTHKHTIIHTVHAR